MISIRKYLDSDLGSSEEPAPAAQKSKVPGSALSALWVAYRSTLSAMSRAGTDACPATGRKLEKGLNEAIRGVSGEPRADAVATAGEAVDQRLHDWGRETARHFEEKAAEVKEILLAMAQTAASVGERDQRCAEQINGVTAKLRLIASLEDISEMRRSIEQSAANLKSSIERMTSEGKAVLTALEAKVSNFQAKLEEAEEAASSDALTRLRSRMWVESQLEKRIAAGSPFCVAILDIDGFKEVNDTYGHVVGDEILKQFATELRLGFRTADLVGRWGGDEFIVVLDTDKAQAEGQVERIKAWVCGKYTVEGAAGPVKLKVDASIGLAQFAPQETLKELLDRADTAMYRCKGASRGAGGGVVHAKARTA